MKKIVLMIFVFLVSSVFGIYSPKKERLVFEQGDVMFYLMSGYPKVPGTSILSLFEQTTIPPLGLGFQFSIADNWAAGTEFIYTYINKNTGVDTSTVYKQNYMIAAGKLLFHYPYKVIDPYFGGGVGYYWVRNEIVGLTDDFSRIYFVVVAGVRLAFGAGSPFGIFIEGSFPYPIISGGFYVRFSVF